MGSDILQKSALQIRSLRTSRSGWKLTSESKIACSMCARSVLSVSLAYFIFFNESELGLYFSSLSVLLCLIQIEIIGGAQAPPAPPLPTALCAVQKSALYKGREVFWKSPRINFHDCILREYAQKNTSHNKNSYRSYVVI